MSEHGHSKPEHKHKPRGPQPLEDHLLKQSLTCPPNVSFAKDIAPLFLINPNSVPHMIEVSKNSNPPLNPTIDLTNLAAVKAWAGTIYSELKSGNMPEGGPQWTADQLNLFVCWGQQGFKP